jgi:hypothetical protein
MRTPASDPAFVACGLSLGVEEFAVLRYCWTLRWLHPAHLGFHAAPTTWF